MYLFTELKYLIDGVLLSHRRLNHCIFLTTRKCQQFGVCCEARGEQVNYLVDENDQLASGKLMCQWYTIILNHILQLLEVFPPDC